MNPQDAPDIYLSIFKARALTNLKLGNYREAVTDCNWAVFLRVEDGESYYLRALAKINAKEFGTVCDDLLEAKQLGSEEATVLSRRYCRYQATGQRLTSN
jgi:hypothetical protein